MNASHRVDAGSVLQTGRGFNDERSSGPNAKSGTGLNQGGNVSPPHHNTWTEVSGSGHPYDFLSNQL